MKKYKLTTQDLETYNDCKWTIGQYKVTDGSGELCSKGWLHYYHNPILAELLNPIHANIGNPKLFEVNAIGKHKNDNYLKGGCTKMKLVKEIPLLNISITQRVAVGILISQYYYKEETYTNWSNNWLNNKDRSYAAAYDAARAARAAYAAYAAASAAYAAYAARTAVYDAADAVVYAAAADAARAAANAGIKDFYKILCKCAKQCLNY